MKTKSQTTTLDTYSTEIAVLGGILIDSTAIDRIISDFSVNLFLDSKNKIIADSILKMYRKSQAIDILTLVNQLTLENQLENLGGASYIASITSKVAGSNNISFHIRILQESALRRNLIKIGQTATNKCLDLTLDVFDLFSDTQNQLDDAIKKVINYEIKGAGDIHNEILLKSIEVLKKGTKSGVQTGFRLLDNLTNGWQNSDLIILAGRPSMGKTAAAISMCIFPSIEQNEAIAIFSLEMSNEQLVSRMQSYLSGVNVSKIVKKQLTMDEIDMISKRAIGLKTAPLFIDDTPNISLLDLKGKARKLKKENNIKLIVIDYLQLMRSGTKSTSREQEIAEISRGLKGLAKELNIPVIALSQLSRSVEQRGGNRKPMLQDLRESGQIEQDADMVLFCYRPEYYGFDNYEVGNNSFDAIGLFMLIIAKHRNGELGEIPLKFIHEQTKVTNHEFGNKQAFESTKSNTNSLTKNNDFDIEMSANSITANISFDDNDFFKPDPNDSTPF
jgi:replicative DNA helicase